MTSLPGMSGENSSNSTDLSFNQTLGEDDTWTDKNNIQWHLHMIQRNECLTQVYEEQLQTTGFCPRVWDQLLCWPPTPPDTHVSISCQETYAFTSHGNATRFCQTSGVWAGNGIEDTVNGWTNYTDCLDAPPDHAIIYEWLPTIKQMSIIGYSVSLVTLIISFGILASLRKLRCPRNVLHLHLFASFMMRAIVVLLKSFVLRNELTTLPPVLQDQTGDSSPATWWCKLLITLWQYFILANYSWLLMEGLYLHNLIFLALFSDSSAITKHVILGWGLPLVCVVCWASMKAALDDMQCWTVNHVQWIFWLCIRIPVAVSNFVNFFFFINVTRVLMLKLRSSITPESMKYRRLAKSTLVLVPLFGVHYFLLWGLSTSSDTRVELAWLLLDQVFSSFQGFCVAVLYCLMNGEVRQELRKLYNRFRGEQLNNASYSTVVSHTRPYFSKGRPSCNSIHSASDRRGQTPSPQFPRSGDGNSPCNPFSNLSVGPSPVATPKEDLEAKTMYPTNNGTLKVYNIEMVSRNPGLDKPKTPQDSTSLQDGGVGLVNPDEKRLTHSHTKEFYVSLQNSDINENPKASLLQGQDESML